MSNLATVQPPALAPASNPFEPQSLEQAMSLAKTLAASQIIPDALRNKPADVLVILMTGRELGIGPMQAMRGISVIKGKPVLSADLMVAQCLRHRGVCEFFRLVESTPTAARYQTKRVGSEPVELAWTIDDAKRAGLDGGQNWRAHPAAMLRARCASALARAVYPDLVGGIYEESEGEEIAGKARSVTVSPPPEAPAQPEPQAPAIDVKSEPVPSAPTQPDESLAKKLWIRAKAKWGNSAMAHFTAAVTKAGIPRETPSDAWTLEQVEQVELALFPPAPEDTTQPGDMTDVPY